jgi:hypothetical protein
MHDISKASYLMNLYLGVAAMSSDDHVNHSCYVIIVFCVNLIKEVLFLGCPKKPLIVMIP